MIELPEVLHLIIDSEDMDPGTALLSPNRFMKGQDPRFWGRFGKLDGKHWLETYGDEGKPDPDFGEYESVYVEASSRRAAVRMLALKLGYPRGVEINIKFE